MARKHNVNRTWFLHELQGTITVAGQTLEVILLDFPEGGVGPGPTLLRLFGNVNVYMSATAGSPDVHVWHGLGMVNSDMPTGVNEFGVFNADANDESWLYREPLPMYGPAGTIGATSNEWHQSIRFDWLVRGGKGSTLRTATQFRYVHTLTTGVVNVVRTYAVFFALYQQS